jgi:hypothetical protein
LLAERLAGQAEYSYCSMVFSKAFPAVRVGKPQYAQDAALTI